LDFLLFFNNHFIVIILKLIIHFIHNHCKSS